MRFAGVSSGTCELSIWVFEEERPSYCAERRSSLGKPLRVPLAGGLGARRPGRRKLS